MKVHSLKLRYAHHVEDQTEAFVTRNSAEDSFRQGAKGYLSFAIYAQPESDHSRVMGFFRCLRYVLKPLK